jgi:hypothetical protein
MKISRIKIVPTEWSRWFAWHPVRTPTAWVWLDSVYRKRRDGTWFYSEFARPERRA